MGTLQGSCRRKPPETRREGRRKSHMDAPSSSPPSTIYQQSPGKALKNSPQPQEYPQETPWGKLPGSCRRKPPETHREGRRGPPGRRRKTPKFPPGKPLFASRPTLRWQGLRPHFHMPAHLPFHFHPSASHHTPPKHPRHPAHGAWVRQLSANGTGSRPCRHPARRVGVRLHGAKAPRPPKRRRRQAPARGLAAVNSRHRPIRNEKKHPSPLLVGLGCVNTGPTALAGRTAAPCSWGLGA